MTMSNYSTAFLQKLTVIISIIVAVFIVLFIIMAIINSKKLKKDKFNGTKWTTVMHIGPIPIPWHKYTLLQDRFIEQSGVFVLNEKEFMTYVLFDVELSESIIERLAKRGTITLRTRDEKDKTIVIKGVSEPRKTKEMFSATLKEASKNRKEIFRR